MGVCKGALNEGGDETEAGWVKVLCYVGKEWVHCTLLGHVRNKYLIGQLWSECVAPRCQS